MRPLIALFLMSLVMPAWAAEPAPAPMAHDMHHMSHGEAPATAKAETSEAVQTPAPALPEATQPTSLPQPVPQAAPDRRGGTLLESVVKDGVREFHLTAAPLAWPITEDTTVSAYAYNEQVAGPTIRVKAGEKVRILFTNNLPEPSTVHWHGVDVPLAMDGVPDISQPAVKTGETFAYEFTVPNSVGTFFYHSHYKADVQQALGLSGAFIIDPAEGLPPTAPKEYTLLLSEWTVKNGHTMPSMPMEGMFPNFFTINGKAYPETETLQAKVGQPLLLRLINAGSFNHPIHLHGAPFKIVATDGHPVPAAAQLTKDTLSISPGERYDLLWTPTRAGTWFVHCHINHHTMNGEMSHAAEGDSMGGMVMAIEVSE